MKLKEWKKFVDTENDEFETKDYTIAFFAIVVALLFIIVVLKWLS